MGIQLKTVSVKWDPDTLRMCDDLQEKFSPFVEGRSQTSRLVVKLMYRIVSTEGTVQVITKYLQGLSGNTSSSQPEIPFPAFPEVGKHQEFEHLLQQAAVPKSFFPKFGFKSRVVQ